MKKFLLIFAACALLTVGAIAQEQHPASTPPPASAQSEQAGSEQNATSQTPGQELAHASNEAAEGDATEHFKHSPVVRWMSKHLGVSPTAEYWVLYSIDFVIIALAIAWIWKKNIPGAFRARTATIRKTMDEAQAASADANRRLSDIEGRLSKLDQEIASMRAAAEQEAAAEEARIRAASEEESKRIVEGAQAEIESASRVAQRELKAYAAELAVALAEKKIHVDPNTDRALVERFSRELGNGNGGSR